MKSIHVALLGFGTVGTGVYEIITQQQKRFEQLLGRSVKIVAILINDESKERNVDGDVKITSDFDEVLSIPDLDVVIEAIVGVEPANAYLERAIDRGLEIITANKELFAHKGYELQRRAKQRGTRIRYEATVAGGVPIISALRNLLQVNEVVKIEAILNGTSNYILSKMRTEGIPFEHALREAQQKGFAEADPTNDIEGFDAFYKINILAELLFGERLDWSQVTRKGIRGLTLEQIREAELEGFRFKHVATLTNDNKLIASVEPKLISENHPLYSVEGVDNVIVVTGDLVGQLVFQGPGAGKFPTASAIVEDLVGLFKLDFKVIKVVS